MRAILASALQRGFEEEGKTSFGKSWVSSDPRLSSRHLLLFESLQYECLDLLEGLKVWKLPCIQLGRETPTFRMSCSHWHQRRRSLLGPRVIQGGFLEEAACEVEHFPFM